MKMWIAVIFAITTILLSAGSVEGAPKNASKYDTLAFCEPYCDVYGYYQPGKWCSTDSGHYNVYCCGSEHDRYCCTDASKDVGDLFPPVNNCPMTSWWYYQWRVIVGLLTTLVVMIMMAACCYYCCGGETRIRAAALRRHAAEQETGDRSREIVNNFDPSSPYAFTPPEYDSLPKEPPKYGDIFNPNGQVNPAYTGPVEGESGTNQYDDITPVETSPENDEREPPPVYTITDNVGNASQTINSSDDVTRRETGRMSDCSVRNEESGLIVSQQVEVSAADVSTSGAEEVTSAVSCAAENKEVAASTSL